jgi:hypothetical protein
MIYRHTQLCVFHVTICHIFQSRRSLRIEAFTCILLLQNKHRVVFDGEPLIKQLMCEHDRVSST